MLRRVHGELRGRVEALERSEHIRAAEHADMVDRLDRLYKRISARIARDTTPEAGTNPRPDLGTRAPGESVLELRKKLGR